MSSEVNENDSWYEVSFYKGLTEPSLLFGCPKGVIVFNALIAFLMILWFGFWPILFFSFIFHQFARYVCKNDTYLFAGLISYMKSKRYYKS